jgi:endo-1,3(4)-beta-glucanase
MHPILYSDNTVEFDGKLHCTPSLNGDACVVKGSAWVLKEDMYDPPSFFAPRPPKASAIPHLAKALANDLDFRVPDYYLRGAGDTYFSGKMLAKLSRILVVYKEVSDICDHPSDSGKDYVKYCKKASLPPKEQFDGALDHLRAATQVWIDGTAETPFVFDSKWAGLVSCGCWFNGDTQKCDNVFPTCPSFEDPGLDFGHGFYNDHHFHQGYHIYAAATVAYFDPEWGKEMFENVLLLIRDIANPSPDDHYFPTYRMKDWYLGNSWAGGIAMAYPNGRNQESSSESIAAYEAVSLFGSVMANVWADDDNKAKTAVSKHIREVGRLLTATELRSADRYWHVRQTGPKAGIYPPQYKPLVVGIMWNMMAQFQTWFGSAPHLAYGIQLLPLTPISEKRDDIGWCNQLYPSFAESCKHATDCDEEGWGILQHAILATVGHSKLAIEYVEGLPEDAFTSAGGNGHSLSNSIWYYATRPATKPLELPNIRKPSPTPASGPSTSDKNTGFNCGCPETCSEEVLNYPAGGFTCGERIEYLMTKQKKSAPDACGLVAGVEFTDLCGGCDPNRCVAPRVSPVEVSTQCPPCSVDECKDNGLNRCPVLDAPFLCTDGNNEGGCSMIPWTLNLVGGSNCNKCCQLTYKCSLLVH